MTKGVFRRIQHERAYWLTALPCAVLACVLSVHLLSLVLAVTNDRPSGVTHPDRLFKIERRTDLSPTGSLPFAILPDIAAVPGIHDATAFLHRMIATRGQTGLVRTSVAFVASNYCQVLGISPRTGRCDLSPGFALVRSGFAAATGASLGDSLSVNGRSFTIVGLLADNLLGVQTSRVDVYLPMTEVPAVLLAVPERARRSILISPSQRAVQVIARARSDVSTEALTAQLNEFYVAHEPPERAHLVASPLRWGSSSFQGLVREALGSALTVGVVVLLLAGLNLLYFHLVWTVDRRTEILQRLIVGATPWQVLRELAAEGASRGMIAAVATSGAAVWLGGIDLAPLYVRDTSLVDAVAARWTPVAALVFGVLVILLHVVLGSLPAIWTMSGTNASVMRGTPRLLHIQWLVGFQSCVVIALALLAAGGVKTTILTSSARTGFILDDVVITSIEPRQRGFTPEQTLNFFRRLHDNADAAFQGTFAIARNAPLSMSGWGHGMAPSQQSEFELIDYDVVSRNYFDVVGVPILHGGTFDDSDDGSQATIIINRALSKHWFGVRSPLGETVRVAGETRLRTVIGVVDNVLVTSRDPAAFAPMAYLPVSQAHPSMGTESQLLVRSKEPHSVIPTLTGILNSIEPDLISYDARTGKEQLSRRNWQAVSVSRITHTVGGFSVATGVLAVYLAIVYLAVAKQRELAIRTALGASPRALVAWGSRVLLKPLGVGLVGGMALGWACQLLIRSNISGFTSLSGSEYLLVASTAGVVLTLGILPNWMALTSRAEATILTSDRVA